MNSATISQILQLIERAEREEQNALHPENGKSLGYPYVAGYQRSTLSNIKQILVAING
jgi:hypothetical protein